MHLVCSRHPSRRHQNLRPVLFGRKQASDRYVRSEVYGWRLLPGGGGHCGKNQSRSDRRVRTTADEPASVHYRLAKRRQPCWFHSACPESRPAAQQLAVRRLCNRQSRSRQERFLPLLRNAVLIGAPAIFSSPRTLYAFELNMSA